MTGGGNILGIDGGLRTFGYGVVEPRSCRIKAAGVLIQEIDEELSSHADREHRLEQQADLVIDLVRTYKIDTVAVEQMSFAPKGSAASKIGIGMSAGGVIALCRALGLRRRVVPPKAWQRAIVPPKEGEKRTAAVSYDEVYAALATFVDVETLLADTAPSKRNHAIDGCGIALYAAVVDEKPLHVKARKERRA